MSGICGIVLAGEGGWSDTIDLSPMVRALGLSDQHDEFTIRLGSVSIGACGYPRRLAGVVKGERAGQSVALAFHGSLYNLKELALAEQDGIALYEGLLRLYLKDGIAFLQQLRGEFALALWDGSAETLYLVTDRFRIHPLFYYQDRDKLAFASRMQGILACPVPLQRTVNHEAIVDIVASSIVPTPKTIFQEVKKLPPGHVLTYHRGKLWLAPYWEVNFLQPNKASEGELARRLKTYFTEAVSVRLARDEPSEQIGTFLSGGIDSSTVTGVLTQLTKRSIKSFSIGFVEQQFNEINYARIAAQAFGAEHYEYFVTPADVRTIIPLILETFDEPFANASAIPTYFCAKLAYEHGVAALYAGDGGDELFAGNERYATQRLFEYYYRVPAWLRESLLKPVVFALSEKLPWGPLIKGKKYIQRASIPYPERLFSYGIFKTVPMATLLTDDLLETLGKDYDPYAAIKFHYFQAPAQSELDRQLYIDLKLAIVDNDLFKVTRMTEAAGVTVRYPFLDHRLAEFATTVPAAVKMRGRQLRSFFKRAYADLLPVETRTKQKHGFGLPIPVWLRTDRGLNEMMHDLLFSARSIQRGYFRKQALEELVACHKTDETSFYGTILWNLMILELWPRRYAESTSGL